MKKECQTKLKFRLNSRRASGPIEKNFDFELKDSKIQVDETNRQQVVLANSPLNILKQNMKIRFRPKSGHRFTAESKNESVKEMNKESNAEKNSIKYGSKRTSKVVKSIYSI